MVDQRAAGLPIEHVLGWAEFCDLRIAVDPGVFVPRHRTEFLARQASALARPGAIVVDLCCGSGALGAARVTSTKLTPGAASADGAGANDVVAALPLAEGYNTTFRNFDLMSQKVQMRQLKVTGSEKVTVPAGTFDAWKVEIAPADGATGQTTTLWVDKSSRKAVKMSTIIPEMNGAIATAELTK